MTATIKIALILMLIAGIATAQEKTDTTRFKFGSTHLIVVGPNDSDSLKVADDDDDDEQFNAWEGLELGVNGLLTADGSTSLPKELNYMEIDYARSMTWNLNFGFNWNWLKVKGEENRTKPGLGLISGLGLSFKSYSFENNTVLLNVSDSTFGLEDEDVHYDKNKLRNFYVRVPLMLQFDTKRWKGTEVKHGFHLAAGAVAGLRVSTVYKRKYEDDGRDRKIKIKDDYNLSPFQLDAEVRFGYGNLCFFASYALTPLFEDNKGPELYPVTVGVSLTKLI